MKFSISYALRLASHDDSHRKKRNYTKPAKHTNSDWKKYGVHQLYASDHDQTIYNSIRLGGLGSPGASG